MVCGVSRSSVRLEQGEDSAAEFLIRTLATGCGYVGTVDAETSLRMRRASRAVLSALAAICALTACEESAGPDTSGQRLSVVITPAADTINALGDTVALAAVVTDANGVEIPSPPVTWRATPQAVVAVDGGRVVSLTTGMAAVIATAGTAADTVQVLSRQIAATLELARPLPALVVGESFEISVTATDSNGIALSSSEFDWISAAPNVVSVSAGGVMRGESVGSATLTVLVPGRSLDVTARVLQPLTSIGERIAVGSNHSCALNVAGEAFCWGTFFPGGGPQDLWPQRVAGGHIFRAIAADGFSACGLTPDSAAYCWGWNDGGQLGDGTTQRRTAPARVIGAPPLASIAVGYGHTCGLTGDGAAYCWGRHPAIIFDPHNNRGDSIAQPVAEGMVFRTISAGFLYTCGVTTSDIAYCWGTNLDGELGDGTTENRTMPTRVAGDLRFADVQASERHTCGLTTSGHAYCWGLNEAGQLGDGTQTRSLIPVAVAGGHTFTSVDAAAHSCAVTSSGAGYCWGYNYNGQLGNGGTGPEACTGFGPNCATTPQPVSGGLAFGRILPSRYGHSCGRTRDGAIYCWGRNDFGQIGNGATLDPHGPQEHRPVRVYLP